MMKLAAKNFLQMDSKWVDPWELQLFSDDGYKWL